MTIWEFLHCIEGFADFHRTEEPAPPAMEEDRLAALGIDGF